jgi:hypothetical protein
LGGGGLGAGAIGATGAAALAAYGAANAIATAQLRAFSAVIVILDIIFLLIAGP